MLYDVDDGYGWFIVRAKNEEEAKNLVIKHYKNHRKSSVLHEEDIQVTPIDPNGASQVLANSWDD